jgi:surfeit locus 1 family protein
VNGARSQRLRTSLAVPTIFALVAFAAFIGLGTWQVQRKAWKEALIGELEQRSSMAPTALPAHDQWAKVDQARDEFRRVKFSAAFVPGAEALVYSSGSALRSDASGPGYWVFAPAHLSSGDVVVVNRGFVPEGRQDPASRPGGQLAGPMELRGLFAPADDPGRNLWFVRDHVAIAAGKGWGEVAPFFVELESPQPPGGLPHPDALKVSLRNEHLQYAITWYSLAAVVAVMFVLWIRARSRARSA